MYMDFLGFLFGILGEALYPLFHYRTSITFRTHAVMVDTSQADEEVKYSLCYLNRTFEQKPSPTRLMFQMDLRSSFQSCLPCRALVTNSSVTTMLQPSTDNNYTVSIIQT